MKLKYLTVMISEREMDYDAVDVDRVGDHKWLCEQIDGETAKEVGSRLLNVALALATHEKNRV